MCVVRARNYDRYYPYPGRTTEASAMRLRVAHSILPVWSAPVHIALGRDKDGKKLVAKGIIGIGQYAMGVICISQFGLGGLCISQFGIGVLALAQFSIALASVSQFAVAVYAVAQIGISYDGVGQVLLRIKDVAG
jgi:hypothetical protein